jgi:CRP-like cAMP-binding protein
VVSEASGEAGGSLRKSGTKTMHPRDQRRATGNGFVDALPYDAADAITRVGDFRVLAEGTPVAVRGEPIRDVLFPMSGAIWHFEEHGDGRRVEIAAIGSDGVSGFEALLDQPRAQFTAAAGVPTSLLAVDVRKLQRIHDASPEFGRLLRRYAVVSIRLAAIGAACEQHHHLTARLARLMIEMHDHAGSAEVALTHDRAARMLGARRPGVTRAAAELVRHGAIRWDRGRLRLLDIVALEVAACLCHSETRTVLHELYAAENVWRTPDHGKGTGNLTLGGHEG